MLESLTHDERALVRRALVAAAEGPFFSDSDVHTLLGVWRAELREVIQRFPTLSGEMDFCAVNNSLLNLSMFPHRCDAELEARSLTPAAMLAVLSKVRTEAGEVTGAFE